MTLGSTQKLIPEIFMGGKGRPARKAENLAANLWAHCLENVGASMSHNPMSLHCLSQG
jgi:hypothetical protein